MDKDSDQKQPFQDTPTKGNSPNFGISEKDDVLHELKNKGEKFTYGEVLVAFRDSEGNPTFLEEGKETAGLKHIQIREHFDEILKHYNIDSQDRFPSWLEKVMKSHIPIKGEKNRLIYDLYNPDYYLIVVRSSNGYIVTVFEEEKRRTKGE